MRSYEHTFIARQDLSPQQAQALADTYAGVITENGGEVTKNEYWGLRNLAYRIKKNRKGHYLHLNLRASSAAIDELERQERLSDDVIRYLTVRVDELDDSPSIIMQVRSSREERSRRPHDDGPPRRHDGERRPQDDDSDRPRRHDGERRAHEGERPRRSAEPRPAETSDDGASGEAAGEEQ
jgi:small subunit ribosomal protein S6